MAITKPSSGLLVWIIAMGLSNRCARCPAAQQWLSQRRDGPSCAAVRHLDPPDGGRVCREVGAVEAGLAGLLPFNHLRMTERPNLLPMLRPARGGDLEATCGRCLDHSVGVSASSGPQHAWA